MPAIDLTYLKKRAHMTRDFDDQKVQAAMAKIVPPPIVVIPEAAKIEGIECVAGKQLRDWIDLIPDDWRGFVRFGYQDDGPSSIDTCIRAAMTLPAWKSFKSFVSKEWNDYDLVPMRIIVWRYMVLGKGVGIDFGSFEMNHIWNGLPIDISKDKIKIETPSFGDFYKMIRAAKWLLESCQTI